MLLHHHPKLGRWLPPGGHVEHSELPDEAAVREVLEETGVRVRLVGRRGLDITEPHQLVVPAGIQVERIYRGHEHIDLVYFAVPTPYDVHSTHVPRELARRDRVGWYEPGAVPALGASEEIHRWAVRAVREVPTPASGGSAE